MIRRLFEFCLLLSLIVSCSDRNSSDLYRFQSKHIIDPTDKSDCFDVVDRIKSIDVLKLTVDDSWVHLRYPRMGISESGYYFFSDYTDYLIGYDNEGNLKFSKQIKGRGRGEIISVGNFYVRNDSLMIYDRSLGRMLYFTQDGNFRSYLNQSSVKAEKLYKTNNGYLGISIFGAHEFDGHYCVKYDNEGTPLESYLSLPDYYIGYNATIGYTDMSYLFHDTLRFRLMHDYNIFSLTENGIESSYRFKSNHEMPSDYYEGKTGLELMSLEVSAQTYAEGFTDSFSEFAETDNYLMLNFYDNKKNQMMLLDKKSNKYGLMFGPDSFFDESEVSELTTLDIWKYIMFSFTRLCVYDNSIYGCASYSLYEILSMTESLHDEKIKAFYNQVKDFVTSQKITDGDMFFFKMNLL